MLRKVINTLVLCVINYIKSMFSTLVYILLESIDTVKYKLFTLVWCTRNMNENICNYWIVLVDTIMHYETILFALHARQVVGGDWPYLEWYFNFVVFECSWIVVLDFCVWSRRKMHGFIQFWVSSIIPLDCNTGL